MGITFLNLQRNDRQRIKHDNYTQEMQRKKISVWRTSLFQYKKRSTISKFQIPPHQRKSLRALLWKQSPNSLLRKNLHWLFQTQLITKSFRKPDSKSKSIQSRSIQKINLMIQRSVLILDLVTFSDLLLKVCKILNLLI